jgi:hypothetical protein
MVDPLRWVLLGYCFMAIESLTNGVVEDNFNKIGDVEVLLRMLYLFIYFSSVTNSSKMMQWKIFMLWIVLFCFSIALQNQTCMYLDVHTLFETPMFKRFYDIVDIFLDMVMQQWETYINISEEHMCFWMGG